MNEPGLGKFPKARPVQPITFKPEPFPPPYGPAPAPRMRSNAYRRPVWPQVLLVSWALLVALLLALALGVVGVYGAVGSPNGGITVSVSGYSGGVELWGAPGFFDCRVTGC